MDLWGNLNLKDDNHHVVISILQEQAKLLENKTESVLKVRLETVNLLPKMISDSTYPSLEKQKKPRYPIATNFNIVSPGLDNYTYTLFTVYHNPETEFPVELDTSIEEVAPHTPCDNEREFLNHLHLVLSSEKVTNAIKTIYSKSKTLKAEVRKSDFFF
ncbi:hypothetical protein [Brevibacillus dissolubilis]|uniref:hypothetical protein n=1 Tax=Brevibacillus dissolubilis TaxID=1844116 RepID=UPI00111722A8|nr:hypothetical protein [Brevibacillus dissolubilis]